MFRVMQGERLSRRRLFSRTYLDFFVLTLWDYLTQEAVTQSSLRSSSPLRIPSVHVLLAMVPLSHA